MDHRPTSQQHEAQAELLATVQKVSLSISDAPETLYLGHYFNWKDGYNWGAVLITLGGIFLVAVTCLQHTDLMSLALGLLLGVGMAIFGILSLMGQVSDYLRIEDGVLGVRYGLKKRKLKVHSDMKISTQYELSKIRTIDSMGNDFIGITLNLQDGEQKLTILKFVLHNRYADQGSRLAKEITRMINVQLRHD